jgi:hypothetical protein
MDAYARALERDDAAAASALLAPAARAGRSAEQLHAAFARRRDVGPELRRQARRAAESEAIVEAGLAYSRYETLSLGYIDGAWRITGGVADVSDTSTPRAAVVTFLRGVGGGDAAAVLSVIPSAARAYTGVPEVQAWLAENATELEEIVALVELALARGLTEQGDNATLAYGASVMRLEREPQGWVIVDVR